MRKYDVVLVCMVEQQAVHRGCCSKVCGWVLELVNEVGQIFVCARDKLWSCG